MANGAHNKAILEPLLRAMQDFEAPQVQSLLQELMAHDAVAHMCLPFNDVTGPTALYETCYQPLLRAMPDLERRDFIIMASTFFRRARMGGVRRPLRWHVCGSLVGYTPHRAYDPHALA